MNRLNLPGIIICILSMVILIYGKESPNTPNTILPKTGNSPVQSTRTLQNINQWSYWLQWNGQSGRSPITTNAGGIFPRGTANAIFQDGFIWGGIIDDSTVTNPLRVGGSTYRSGTVPGYIDMSGNPINPDQDTRIRVYRIRKDFQTVSDEALRLDAAELSGFSVNGVTSAMIRQVREQYAADWNEWPVDLGAPFNDDNQNGIYEPDLGETPGILNADQVAWLVINDFSSFETHDFSGSPPLNLELQITTWAFKQGEQFANSVYRRLRFTNRSSFTINDMYAAQWSDPDLGHYTDDLVGCDSLLALGFAYNGYSSDLGYQNAGLAPPAAGYTLLQGPIVPSPGDTAKFNFQKIPDYKNLKMTSFSFFAAGSEISDPPLGNYDGTLAWYNLLRGFKPDFNVENPSPYVHGDGAFIGSATKFPLNGDPFEALVNGNSNLDVDGRQLNLPPGDRRMVLATGPFSLQPEDTQELIFVLSGATGGDPGDPQAYLKAVSRLKEYSEQLRFSFTNGIYPGTTTTQITHNTTEGTSHIMVAVDLRLSGNINTAMLNFSPDFGTETNFSFPLFDDGMAEDSIAGDGIWSGSATITNRQYPYDAELALQNPVSLSFPGMLNNLRLRPAPKVSFRIVSENGRQDGNFNHREKVFVGFDIQNDDINEINEIIINDREYTQTIPPGATGTNPDFFEDIYAPYSGDSITVTLSMEFDRHTGVAARTFPIIPWEPDNSWGDTLEVESISGPTYQLFPIIADPSLLNGHLYQVTFYGDTSSSEIRWHLTDTDLGTILFEGGRISDSRRFIHPVIDGIQFQVNQLQPDFANFAVVANAAGPLDPPDGAAAHWQGFPSAHPTDRQQATGNGQWLIHTGDDGRYREYGNPEFSTGANFLGRVTRNGINWPEIFPWDFEIRFTGSSIAWDVFSSSNFIEIPFEIWNIGIGTPDDPGDDYRMFPIVLDNNGDGQWNFDGTDHSASNANNDPQTDWLYFYNPTGHSADEQPGTIAYDLIADSIAAGAWTGFLGTGVLERLVLFNRDGGIVSAPTFPANINQLLPEEGTIFRIITVKPNKPGDILSVRSPAPLGIAETRIPETFFLDQNYPNPFNPETQIQFGIPNQQQVQLEIYNILGQLVHTIIDKNLSGGQYSVIWNGKNDAGQQVASGLYFYRFTAGNFTKTRKMILIR